MSKQVISSWPLDHPEITAIALDIMITPARRAHYSDVVLMLADAALERIRRQLAVASDADGQADGPQAPPPG